ncbi:MAG: ATP-dependent DNA helicase DinG [Gammaproteobacteria bacterium]|nr:ATP-dependent DNA helicase DinG [Gammaproteobacteria bacterium]
MLTNAHKSAINDAYRAMRDQLPGFAKRNSQLAMIGDVAQTVASGQQAMAVIEAGTGLGKSMSYCLGAIPVALAEGKRVIISTNTIALQEQLFAKDLPFFAGLLSRPLQVALAKGSSRYACPQRMLSSAAPAAAEEESSGLLFAELASQRADPLVEEDVERLYKQLASKRWSGDLDELERHPSVAVLKRVARDRHSCLKRSCPQFNDCPFYAARKTLQQADVIVTNHALLLADTGGGESGGRILASGRSSQSDDDSSFGGGLDNCVVIIDEAHNLPAVASDSFAFHYSLKQSLGWITALPRIARLLGRSAIAAKCQGDGETLLSEGPRLLDATHDVRHLLESLPLAPQLLDSGVYRFDHARLPTELDAPLSNAFGTASALNKALTRIISQANSAIDGDRGLASGLSSLLANCIFAQQRLEFAASAMAMLLSPPATDQLARHAAWVEREETGEVRLHAAEINAGGRLRSSLFERVHATILTSATLRTLGNYQRFCQRAGIHGDLKVRFATYESPFPYDESTLLLARQGHDPSSRAHREAMAQAIPQLAAHERGSLVIFTSKAAMRETYELLPAEFAQRVLMQGELSKSAIIRRHGETIASGQPSVIFGLFSFAEGVDLKNELCTLVCLDKLPFQSLADQVLLAESEVLEAQGRSPFVEIMLPECSARLRQIVGRLIRTEQDRGTVVIFDERLTTKSYGKRLLASLPAFRHEAL